MFERFTNQSRRVVVLAQEEARMLNHNYIGTEHLLLGMLHEGKSSAALALNAVDVTLTAGRDQVVAIVGRGQQEPSGSIPFTPAAKKSLELSLREALQLRDGYIGTGHLLLGLMRQGDNVAVKVLDKLGVDLNDLRARVTRELRDHPEGQDAPTAEHELRRVKVVLHDTVLSLLDTIDDRLSAIERHLGITRPVSVALRSLDEQIAEVRRDKEAAVGVQDFGRAAELRDAEKQLTEQRERVEQEEAAAAAAAAGAAAAAAAAAAAGPDAEGADSAGGTGDAEGADSAGGTGEGAGADSAGGAYGAGGVYGAERADGAEGAGEAAGRIDELGRLRARVARLEQRLREHGLDPEEPQEPPAAAG